MFFKQKVPEAQVQQAPSATIFVVMHRLPAALLLWGALLAGAFAQDVQPVPALTERLIDQTGTLDAAARQRLTAKLAAFEQAKGTQIVVLMVPTTAPEDIFSYTNRVANSWKIGRKTVGDGVVMVVAKNDRRVRIAVAKTLEGAVPDLATSIIIEQAITPRFKQGDFAGGIEAGVDRIIGLVNGEPLPEPTRRDARAPSPGGFQWFDIAVFLFFAVPIGGAIARRIFGRKLGSIVTGGGVGVLAWLFTASLVIGVLAALAAGVFALASGFASAGAGSGGGRGRRGGPFGGGGLGGLGGLGGGLGSGGFGRGGGGFGSGGFGGGGGGFSSGGGGDFGGGGASGSW